MDALAVERYGPAAKLERELAPPALRRLPAPPRLPRCGCTVANSRSRCGRALGHAGHHTAARRAHPDELSWEEFRAAHAAAARLAQARRDGTDDSWWEEPDG